MRRAFHGLLLSLLLVIGLTGAVSAADPIGFIDIGANDSASGKWEQWPVYCVTTCRYMTDGVVRVEDPYCGKTEQKFRIVFYEAPNFAGDRVVLCRPQKNFCNVPLDRLPTQVGCFVLCCNFLQDKTSSIAVGDIDGSGCARVFEDIDFNTGHSEGWLIEGHIYDHMSDIPGSGMGDDEASSVKFVYSGSCP